MTHVTDVGRGREGGERAPASCLDARKHDPPTRPLRAHLNNPLSPNQQHPKKTAIEAVIFKAGPCEPGYAQATPKSPCTLCEAGTYCPGGKLGKQTPCPAGTTTGLGVTGAASVQDCFITCDPGTYALITQGDGAQCWPCRRGFYCPGGPQTGPLTDRLSCPPGFTTVVDDAAGAEACVVVCDPGEYAPFSEGPCQACESGSICPGGPQARAGIEECPDEYPFTNTTAGSFLGDCVGCGTGTSLVNGTCVVLCVPGYYANSSFAVACDECPVGYWCPGGPQTSAGIFPCAAGETTLVPASANATDCLPTCDPGKYAANGMLPCLDCGLNFFCEGGPQPEAVQTPCPDGTFTTTTTSASAGACERCAQGLPPDCAVTTCAPGYFAATPGADWQVCGVGFTCPGGPQTTPLQTPCPDGLTTLTATSTGVVACVRSCPPGTFAPSPTAPCVECGVPYYCPGGFQDEGPLKDPCPQSPPPPYTTLVPNAVNQSQCVIVCPAGQYATTPAGPCIACGSGGVCPGGPQETPLRTACPTGTTTCSTTSTVCITTATDSANCGVCGNACVVGAECLAGTCVCAGTTQPVATATPAPCGRSQAGTLATTTYEYSVKPGGTYAAVYDSYGIPDRYVLRYDSPCGPVAYDTLFTGNAAEGCAASSPCCLASKYPGADCTGVAGKYCPPNPNGGGPQGGAGGGITPDFIIPPTTTKLYATAFGVCGGTKNKIKPTGADGGSCPAL